MRARQCFAISLVLAFALVLAGIAPAAGAVISPPRVRFGDLATVRMVDAFYHPVQTHLCDLDLDGDGDLVVLIRDESGDGIIRTYRGDGQGGFTHVSEILLGEVALDLVVGDLTGDATGFPDVAVVIATMSPATSGFRAWAGTGDCGLSATMLDEHYGIDTPSSIAMVDLDADGSRDLMVPARWDGRLHAYFNNGNGTFTSVGYMEIGGVLIDVEGGYIDHDGYLDLAVLDLGAAQVKLYAGGTAGPADEPDALGSPIAVGAGAKQVAIDDLDWMNLGDLAVLTQNAVNVLRSNGYGGGAGWSRTDYPLTSGEGERMCTFSAYPATPNDLAVLCGTGALEVRFNNGSGAFGAAAVVSRTGWNVSVGAGYLNRYDMKDDLVLCDMSADAVHVLENWCKPRVSRLFGADRYQTASAVAAEECPHGSQYVVIATGARFPDALAGVPLARAVVGPILLTRPDSLPDEVASRIKALGATHAYVLGGASAVSNAVVSQLTSRAGIPAGNIKRLAGRDRYETAYLIAKELQVIHPSYGATKAYIATGENFPDALAGGIAAASGGHPILLTRRDSIPEGTQRALDELPIVDTVVLGGTPSVSNAVYSRLPSPERIYGADRYETATKIAEYAFGSLEFWANRLIIATGENFPDALSAGPLGMPVQLRSSPLLLVRRNSVPASTASFVQQWGEHCSDVYVIGGTTAVSDGVVASLESMY